MKKKTERSERDGERKGEDRGWEKELVDEEIEYYGYNYHVNHLKVTQHRG